MATGFIGFGPSGCWQLPPAPEMKPGDLPLTGLDIVLPPPIPDLWDGDDESSDCDCESDDYEDE